MEIQLSFPTARNTDPMTSHKAGNGVSVRSGTQRGVILRAYLSGEYTDDEIGVLTGYADQQLHPNCNYWKRCSELRQAGYITPTGEVRKSRANVDQQICAITPAGRAALERAE